MRRAWSEVKAERAAGQLELLTSARATVEAETAFAPETTPTEEPTCGECSAPLLPPFIVCQACAPSTEVTAQDAPAAAPEEGLDLTPVISRENAQTKAERASHIIGRCLVTAAGLKEGLAILVPFGGPSSILTACAAQAMMEARVVNRTALSVYANELPSFLAEKHRFDRVILWSDEWAPDEEREYFLHGYELLKTGGKLVAAISTELASDRGFRPWLNKKSATFDEPVVSFRSRGLVMVTLWKDGGGAFRQI